MWNRWRLRRMTEDRRFAVDERTGWSTEKSKMAPSDCLFIRLQPPQHTHTVARRDRQYNDRAVGVVLGGVPKLVRLLKCLLGVCGLTWRSPPLCFSAFSVPLCEDAQQYKPPSPRCESEHKAFLSMHFRLCILDTVILQPPCPPLHIVDSLAWSCHSLLVTQSSSKVLSVELQVQRGTVSPRGRQAVSPCSHVWPIRLCLCV